jgi:RNA polymerase sigma-70 factor (ECF subfamily)
VDTTPPPIDDLVRAAQLGDRQAFSQLYTQFAKPLYGYLVLRCGHRETAEDLLADVWVKAWRSLASCKPEYLSAWLYTIARNTLIDHLRQRRPQVDWERMPEVIDPNPALNAAHARLEYQRISASIDQLTPEQREVFIMRLWDDLSYETIGRVVKKSPTSCRMLMTRALRQLRSSVIATLILFMYATIS